MKLLNSEIAKIAIGLGWTVDPGGSIIWEIKHRYNANEKAAHKAYCNLMDCGLVRIELEDHTPFGELRRGRFVLCDGITEEML